MNKKLDDIMATRLAMVIEKCYENYLATSEDKTSIPMREDAFIYGLLAGLELSNNSEEVLARIEGRTE